jgi:UDP-3-O-[3-hydroxymyristoyl] N-acetylglucosamine deacetylase
MYQHTLRNVIRATGVGLHTGERVFLALCPAPPNSGITFVRTDVEPRVEIRADARNVVDTTLATTLASGGVRISTVEHLLAALSALGVDNVRVEVSAPEVPIMDGSAAPFVFLVQSAGLQPQNALRRFLRIRRTVTWEHGDVRATLSPHDGLRVAYTLVYDHPVFRDHARSASVDVDATSFVREVARARTFGFLADIEKLRSMNLARGGNLDNAVVVDDERILNDGGLRQQDEFVKHKILDAIGDLALFGAPLLGAFDGHRSGHGPNNQLVRRVLADPDAFDYVTVVADPAAHAQAV